MDSLKHQPSSQRRVAKQADTSSDFSEAEKYRPKRRKIKSQVKRKFMLKSIQKDGILGLENNQTVNSSRVWPTPP